MLYFLKGRAGEYSGFCNHILMAVIGEK